MTALAALDRGRVMLEQQQRRRVRMWMRRTIGLSVALLMISSHAMAKDSQTESRQQKPQQQPRQQPQGATAKPEVNASRLGNSWERDSRAAVNSRRSPTPTATADNAGRSRAPDRYIGQPAPDYGALKVIGHPEIGSAAWYATVGNRTASGERLDAVRATAAHRSLPLHSLARVTNLKNGRSVVVRITDRGPVSHKLLIDLSPRAADELAMKSAGIVPVSIEPVAAIARVSAQ